MQKLALLVVALGVCAAAVAALPPCNSAADNAFTCVHDGNHNTVYYWCDYGAPNTPGWFPCAPGTYCSVAGPQSQNPCTTIPPPADQCPNDPAKTAPGICGCGTADTNTDGDSKADCQDGCPNDANKTVPGICGCGTADTNTDGDSKADCQDGCPLDANKTAPGVCGCGTADTDSDGDGTANCHDGCPNDANKLSPGVCGCGTADTDSDGDGTANCLDGCPNDAAKTAPGACGCGNAETVGCCNPTTDPCFCQNNGFSCRGTASSAYYMECSSPFFVGQRSCAPGTTCRASAFTTGNPCW